ncbi:MAG TPA: hypothetical protein VN908_01160 [Gemmatimonadales bacterium]|nr:hypothetical protein [Gemmatimonadales bacterium]
MSRTTILLAIALLTAGCDRPDDSARARELTSRALRGVLAYPQSSLVRVSAGDEAGQMVLTSPAPVSEIVAWYHEALKLNGWQLKSEQQRQGSVTIYAEKERRPVWITLTPNSGGPGTTYTLVGAIVSPDSTRKDSAGGRR